MVKFGLVDWVLNMPSDTMMASEPKEAKTQSPVTYSVSSGFVNLLAQLKA